MSDMASALRLAAIRWHEQHDPDWRGNPWKDGVLIDFDEDDEAEFVAAAALTHVGPRADSSVWTELRGYLQAAVGEGIPLDAVSTLAYFDELKHRSLAPIRAWLTDKGWNTADTDTAEVSK